MKDTVIIQPGDRSRQLGEPLGYVSLNSSIVQVVIGEMRCGLDRNIEQVVIGEMRCGLDRKAQPVSQLDGLRYDLTCANHGRRHIT